MTLKFLSSRDRSEYTVDTESVSCTCSDYVYRRCFRPIGDPERMCKHLKKAFEEHKEEFPKACYSAQDVIANASQAGKVKCSVLDKYVLLIKNAVMRPSTPFYSFCACGEYRRKLEYCNPFIPICVGCKGTANPDVIVNAIKLVKPDVRVLLKSDDKLCLIIDSEITAYLYFIPEEQMPYATLHYTGSQETVLALREKARAKGWDLSRSGLFGKDGLVVCETEQDIYNALGVPYVAPTGR